MHAVTCTDRRGTNVQFAEEHCTNPTTFGIMASPDHLDEEKGEEKDGAKHITEEASGLQLLGIFPKWCFSVGNHRGWKTLCAMHITSLDFLACKKREATDPDRQPDWYKSTKDIIITS